MFSTMPFPVFRDDALPTLPPITTNPFSSSSNNTPYRPTRSSPLSSSPIRVSSASPPLSPRDPNIRRDIQSSPIPPRQPIFTSKFASRPARPNPVVSQKREAAQESRRKLFLKNVRQRAEDQRWERRGGEQEWLKLEWWSLHKDLHQAANADVNGVILDSDIEDAARLREEVMHSNRSRTLSMIPEASVSQERGLDGLGIGADDMLVDMFEQEQQAELDAAMAEAMATAGRGGQQSSGDGAPRSPQWDDDEDYDALFMDYIAQEQQQQEGPVHSQAVGDFGDMDLS